MYNQYPMPNQSNNMWNQYPQQPMQQQQMQMKTELIQVNGVNGAKAYQMQPNSSVALFDMTDNKFYIKASDMANFSTIKTFSYQENLNEDEKEQSSEYVLKSDFNELKNLVEKIISEEKPKANKTKASPDNKTI